MEIVTVMVLPEAGSFSRLFCRLGKSLRFVFTFECETLKPEVVFLPVTRQDLDISFSVSFAGSIDSRSFFVQGSVIDLFRMPVPKLWIFFFLGIVGLVIGILVTQPGVSDQTVSQQSISVDDTPGTTFSSMLEKGGNAIYVEDQLSGISSVRVGFVVLAAPGFVVIFSDQDGVPGQAIGHSDWLEDGGEHLIVPLYETLQEDEVYYAVLFLDDGDGEFDEQEDTQAIDSEDSVVLMSLLARKDAVPESEAILP